MKAQFFHNLTTSFYLWLDNVIQEKGEAYSTQSNTSLTPYKDPSLGGYSVFGSNHQQWVYNEDFGLNIPSSVSIDGINKGRGDGVIFDFNHGRILVGEDTDAESVFCSFTAKTFNIYRTEDPEDILIEKSFNSLEGFGERSNYDKPYNYIAPAIFIKFEPSRNVSSSFGGEIKSSVTFRVFVIADNDYFIQGVLSIFNDTLHRCFPLISDYSLIPFNHFGDLKQPFSYKELYQETKGRASVDAVYSSGVSGVSSKQKTLRIAYSEFDVSCYRYSGVK